MQIFVNHMYLQASILC